jgi:telomerase reverse transcriptase
MLYLLTQTPMFKLVGRDCCMQLAGSPITTAARSWKSQAVYGREALLADEKQQQGRREKNRREKENSDGGKKGRRENQEGNFASSSQQQEEDEEEEERQSGSNKNGIGTAGKNTNNNIATQQYTLLPETQLDDVVITATIERGGGAGPSSFPWTEPVQAGDEKITTTSNNNSNTSKRGKFRLSSWKRKKLRLQQAAAAAEEEEEEAVLPPTQVLLDEDSSYQKAIPTTKLKPSTSRRHPDCWPKFFPRPSEMLLNRNNIFHCATRPRRGLQANHLLYKLKGFPKASRILYAAIFNPRYNAIGRKRSLKIPAYAVFPPAARKIDTKQVKVLPMLEKMVRNVRRCQFLRLLEVHCPLPPDLEKFRAAANGNGNDDTNDEGGTMQLDDDDSEEVVRPIDNLMDELHALTSNTNSNRIAGKNKDKNAQQQFTTENKCTNNQEVNAQGGRKRPISPTSKKPPGKRSSISHHQSQVHASIIANTSNDSQRHQRVGPTSQRLGPASQKLGSASQRHLLDDDDDDDNDEDSDKDEEEDNNGIMRPIGEYNLCSAFTQYRQVSSFLWSVLKRIIPKEMLGSKHNQKALRKALEQFVSLRRHENITVHHVMQKMKISEFPWLNFTDDNDTENGGGGGGGGGREEEGKKKGAPRSESIVKQRLLALWLGWVYTALVSPILRSFFYCTATEAYRQHVFYYRKPVWSVLSGKAAKELRQGEFTAMSDTEAYNILSERKLGVSKLKMLPKKRGLRFIINLSRSSGPVFKIKRRIGGGGGADGGTTSTAKTRKEKVRLSFKAVNTFLKNIYHVLQYEVSRQPEVLGSSVFGYDDVFCRIQPFIRKVRAASLVSIAASRAAAAAGNNNNNKGKRPTAKTAAAAAPKPTTTTTRTPTTTPTSKSPPPILPIYFVGVDVTRAFDHVDIPLLLQIVEPLFKEECYTILKYAELTTRLGVVSSSYRRVAVPSSSTAASISSLIEDRAVMVKGRVFTDSVVYEKVRRNTVLTLLRQHLTGNVVKLGKHWHYQARGIAQGSMLSTLLCSVYLAHLERAHIAPMIAAASAAVVGRGGGGGGGGGSGQHHYHFSTVSSPLQTSSDGTLGALARMAATSTTTGRGGGVASGSGSGIVLPSSGPQLSPHSMLIRWVDDFLLVTSDLNLAKRVMRRMLNGFPDYFVSVNPDKTKMNFPITLQHIGKSGAEGLATTTITTTPPNIYRAADDNTFIKWCGLLINCHTAEIQGDYTRYSGQHLSASFNVPLHRRPGAILLTRICMFLRPKLHALLFDTMINSQQVVWLNLYQAFLLGAMKTHCYIKSLPLPLSTVGVNLVSEAIQSGIEYASKRMVKGTSVSPSQVNSNQLRPAQYTSRLMRNEVRYLALHAFRVVLGKKQSMYGGLLRQIDADLAAPEMGRLTRRLDGVLDPVKSAIFDTILY